MIFCCPSFHPSNIEKIIPFLVLRLPLVVNSILFLEFMVTLCTPAIRSDSRETKHFPQGWGVRANQKQNSKHFDKSERSTKIHANPTIQFLEFLGNRFHHAMKIIRARGRWTGNYTNQKNVLGKVPHFTRKIVDDHVDGGDTGL